LLDGSTALLSHRFVDSRKKSDRNKLAHFGLRPKGDIVDPKNLGAFGQLYGEDLAGWQICPCYLLELKHGLMGFFPAITDRTNVLVVVTNPKFLWPVWDKLPHRNCKVTAFLAVVHVASGIAFHLSNLGDNSIQDSRHSLRVFSREDIAYLIAGEAEPFRWAPGLFGAGNNDFDRPPDELRGQ